MICSCTLNVNHGAADATLLQRFARGVSGHQFGGFVLVWRGCCPLSCPRPKHRLIHSKSHRCSGPGLMSVWSWRMCADTASVYGIKIQFGEETPPQSANDRPILYVNAGHAWCFPRASMCVAYKDKWEQHMAGPASHLGYILEEANWTSWRCEVCLHTVTYPKENDPRHDE